MSARIDRLVLTILVVVCSLLPTLAQTGAEDLDSKWVAICSGATPSTPLGDRCDEILNAGPGSGDRRSEAALGNNLEINAAAGRVGRDSAHDEREFEWSGWNLILGAAFGQSDRDDSSFESGYESDVRTVQLGIDRAIGPMSSIGLMIDTTENDTTFSGGAGQLDSDVTSANLFYTTATDAGHAWQFYAGMASIDHDSRREIDYTLVLDAGLPSETTVTIVGTALGATDADRMQAGAAWSRAFGEAAWTYGPLVRLDYVTTDIDAFTETDDVGLALSYQDQQIDSLTAQAALDAQAAISRDWGVLSPQFRAGWIHELDDDQRTIISNYVGDAAGTPINIATAEPDRNYFELGAGVGFTFKNDVVLFVDLATRVGHEFLDDQMASIGLRFGIGGR